jgi:thymidylate synthase (FAD)
MEVTLVDYSHDPIKTLYTAFRTCYSASTPQEIEEQIARGKISRQQMEEFVQKYLATGHTSPLQQVWFEFAVAGVSRALTHQLVRHHVGISFEQQSQRYVKLGRIDDYKRFVVPPSIAKKPEALQKFNNALHYLENVYADLLVDGIPAEDARYLLPNATASNLKISVNLAEFQHICDIRLCMRAQWEFRHLVMKMRTEIVKKFPIFAPFLAIKCHANRLGYCDEPFDAWKDCPVGKARPHKSQVIKED